MKKTLFIFIGILVVIAGAMVLISHRSEYNAEKRIWNINRQFLEISQAPETVPDQAFEKVAGEYREYLEDFPDSQLRPQAKILLGRVYLMKKDYGKARQELQAIFEEFPDNPELHAETLSVIGKSYELEGNWEEALRIYRGLQKDYPLSNVALSVPLYIAQYYQSQGNAIRADQAFTEAIVHYNQLAGENPNSETEYKALRLLSVCYLAQKKWVEAVNTMEQLLLRYPTPRAANQAISVINNIAITQLKDYTVPIRVYKGFLQNHPEHPLNDTLKQMIEAFEKLKNENVVISITDENKK